MELRETRRETSPARWFASWIVQVSWDIHTICIDLFQMYENHCAMHSKVLIACGRALLANQTAKLGRYPASPATPRCFMIKQCEANWPLPSLDWFLNPQHRSLVPTGGYSSDCSLAKGPLNKNMFCARRNDGFAAETGWEADRKTNAAFWLMSDAIWKNQVHSRILHSAVSACGHDDIAQGKAGKIQFAHVCSNPIHDTQIVRPSCCKSWEGQHHLGGAGFNGNNVPKITVTKFNNGNQATMGRCCCWPLLGRALGRCYRVPPKS